MVLSDENQSETEVCRKRALTRARERDAAALRVLHGSPPNSFTFLKKVIYAAERPRSSRFKARATNSRGKISCSSATGGVSCPSRTNWISVMKPFETRAVAGVDHHRVGQEITHVFHHSELAER